MLTPDMLSAAAPVLVSTTVWAALGIPTLSMPKLRLVGERPTAGAVPVPVSETVWALPLALSVIVIAPLRVPVTVGVKVTLIAQFAPAATLVPQVFVWLKSPLETMLVTVSVAV